MVDVVGGKDKAHNPSITIVLPCDFNCPRNSPSRLNPLIRPSPKLPTSIMGSLLSWPFFLPMPLSPLLSSSPSLSSKKDAGACTTPHGAFSQPLDANLFTNDPSVLK